jgi:type III restriction enzyme
MATGTGKTTVMGMIAAWSILNKVHDRGNAKFSDVVLVVCPNVTIRSRLAELDPAAGPASIYVTRDLVPPDMRSDLTRGRVRGREVGGKQNILVMNDEAHHAYRIRREEPDEDQGELFGDDEAADEFFKEATVWIDGLDRIHKLRGINFCLDLSATPYYLGRVGQDTNRPFPWVTSDFGLIDAIESGLTKIPQLAVRDTTGAATPGYFNIWHWILPQLTPAERGGERRRHLRPVEI